MGRYAIFNGLIYGGGTDVIPNPEGTPTDELHSLQIGDDIYEIVGGGGSGEGYSETLLYEATTPFQTGVITLNDNISNYDVLLFRTKFSDETRADLLLQVSLLQDIGYVANPSTNTKHALLLGFDSYYFRVVKGSETDDNIINIFAASGDQFIYEIYGIKIEGGSSSGGGNASLDATTLYDTPITSTGTYTLADDYNNYDFIGFKAGNGSTETDIRLYAVKDIQDSMNDNLVITNNVTNSWFNFTINADELTIPGKTVSTIYSVIGYKIKGGGSSTNVQRLSPEAYSALPQSEKENGTIYFVHKDAGETTISGTFTTGSTQYEKVIVDCGFKPTSISVILPFSNGNTYAEYDETISTTTSTWEIPMESRTYTITLGSETGESGITDILDNGFKFRCNASNTRNVNCTFEATGVLDNEINKIYYMGNEYTNGGSGGGGDGYKIEKIFDGNVTTTGNITLNKSISNYDELLFVTNFTGVLGESYISTFKVDVSIFKNIGSYTATRGVLLNDWSRDTRYAQVKYVDDMTIDVDAIQVVSIVEIYGVKLEGSGGGTSEGEGVEIYSEDEYIVGKWIDGKKLYQKTYHLAQAITVAGGGTWTDTGIDVSDIETLIDSKFSQDIAVWDAINGINDNGVLKATILASGSLTVDTITLRYTKTVETDAPAWGGSVTNNYANFIDTSNVIDSGSYQGSFTYTATEDCFVNVAVVMSANDSATITIDGELVTSGWCASLNTINPILPLKKGQTLVATASASNTSNYTVYGISYGSGGSSSGSKIEYSTEEKEVGTWIDGSKVYELTIFNDNLTDTSTVPNAMYIGSIPNNANIVTELSVSVCDSNHAGWVTGGGICTVNGWNFGLHITEGKVVLYGGNVSAIQGGMAIAKIRYTKTTT